MYFNTKKERVGNLFLKPFRSRHVSNDTYLKHVTQYIHLNPAELVDSGWKSGKVSSIKAIKEAVSNYPYSSGPDFSRKNRPENAILDPIESRFLSLEAPSIEKSIEEAHDYFASLR